MATQGPTTPVAIPAAGKAIVGSWNDTPDLITCTIIEPEIWHYGKRYVYIGCSYGIAIYRPPAEAKALEAELAGLPATTSD